MSIASMTKGYLVALVKEYREVLHFLNERQHNPTTLAGEQAAIFAHLKWMLNQIFTFIEKDELDKAQRWLGFVQGGFWILRTFNLDDLKNHNSGWIREHNNEPISNEVEAGGTVSQTR